MCICLICSNFEIRQIIRKLYVVSVQITYFSDLIKDVTSVN